VRSLAWMSLALGLLIMSATGCLITDAPQFQAQQHTAPFLVASSADPDPRSVVLWDTIDPPMAGQTFSADVISQDDPAGSADLFTQVGARLYIDYGLSAGVGLPPFRYVLGDSMLPSGGTLDETSGRRISVTWYPSYTVETGCHTATLVVSHIFDEMGCPACDDDFSTLTWQVLACAESNDTCNALPVSGTAGCLPAPLTSCETFHAQSDAPSTCPGITADGGAQ
jgi:hypothetical protein